MIALMLAQRGYSVLVVEKRGDPRSEHAADGTVAKCVAPFNVACSFFVFCAPLLISHLCGVPDCQ